MTAPIKIKRNVPSRFVARTGVKLDLGILRRLNITWGRTMDDAYLMSSRDWQRAETAGAIDYAIPIRQP